jgi:hypothetical protein
MHSGRAVCRTAQSRLLQSGKIILSTG